MWPSIQVKYLCSNLLLYLGFLISGLIKIEWIVKDISSYKLWVSCYCAILLGCIMLRLH